MNVLELREAMSASLESGPVFGDPPMKAPHIALFSILTLFAVVNPSSAFAIVSVTCGTDPSADGSGFDNEVFLLAGEDAFEGPAVKEAFWGIRINGQDVYSETITAKKTKGSSYSKNVEVTVPSGHHSPSGQVGQIYKVLNIYGEATTLEIWNMSGGFAGGRKTATYDCIASVD